MQQFRDEDRQSANYNQPTIGCFPHPKKKFYVLFFLQRSFRRIKFFPNPLHAFSVDSHVAIAEPRRRSELNRFCAVVEHEFHIVDKPPEKRSEFSLEIVALVGNNPGAGLRIDHPDELLLRLVDGPGVEQRFDGMGLVGRKGRYTVGRFGAWRKLAVLHAESGRARSRANAQNQEKTAAEGFYNC